MSDLYGSHFEYGGVSSRSYDLIIANIESARNISLAGEKSSVTVFNKNEKKRYLIDDDYSTSPLSFEMEIVTDDGRCLDQQERRKIEKWLFGHRDYRKLYWDIDDDCDSELYEFLNGNTLRLYLNCRMLNPTKLEYNGGIVGYKFTLEADSNMFWQDPISTTYNVDNSTSGSSSVVDIEIDTDIADYVYPKVTITMGSTGGDVTISNNTDDETRLTKFVGVSANATIIMKGEINLISGQYYEKFQHRNFIRLLDGVNKLTVIGNVKTIKIEYAARRLMS